MFSTELINDFHLPKNSKQEIASNNNLIQNL